MAYSMRLLLASAVVVTWLGADAAFADALDGEWCREAESLTIQGPNILTPGGTQTTGDYARHHFSYVIPAGEPQAGATVEISQLSEEEMDLRIVSAEQDAAPGAWERWRRCKVTS